MPVAKWGHRLAVRRPVAAVRRREGDDLNLAVAGVRAFAICKKPEAREWLARIRKHRGRLPADFKLGAITNPP